MYVRLNPLPCRVVVCFSIAVFLVGVPRPADAESPNRDHAVTSNHCHEEFEDLCGWVELGTHDSTPRPTQADEVQGACEATAQILACAAYLKTGVSVEQIIEPFAMVGPAIENSLETVKQFQQWWDNASEMASKTSVPDWIVFDFLKVDSAMDRRLQLVAAQEPVDVQSFGESVLVKHFEGFPSDPLALKVKPPRKDVLVGCSPMIFTIEETYMAYDMSQRDVKLWSVFPATTRPFCIRDRSDNFDASPMWDEFDQVVHPEPTSASDSIASQVKCSAYCLLDDWIGRIEDWTSKDSLVRQTVRPHRIGQRLAGVLTQRDRLASKAALVLATKWREVKPEPRPSAAGAALLARAGAREFDQPMVDGVNTEMAAQIAATPAGSERR